MHAIRSILVVIQQQSSHDLALKRARRIADATGAHLHLLICADQDDHLEQLCDDLSMAGYSCSAQLSTQDDRVQAIIAAQQSEGCGLVIKQHLPDNPLKRALLTPDDWKLLRYCPAPVLLVKQARNWSDGAVLAAVDIGNSDEQHHTLHGAIIDHGYQLAELARTELHVIGAHASPLLPVADPTFQLREVHEQRYREQCRAFQQQYEIDDRHLHIVEGPADVSIAQVAGQLQASVTVIGSVARTGFAGALIGNTAEVILDTLDSDMLVLKPDSVIDHLLQQDAPH